jgi:acetyltransferase-like isoleucine patch superfamily enzyme
MEQGVIGDRQGAGSEASGTPSRSWTWRAKRRVREIRRSRQPVRDTLQFAFACVVRPRGHLVASTVRYRVDGKVVHDGPFSFGIFCNRLFHAPGDRGALQVADGGRLRIGSNVKIAASARIEVVGDLVIGSGSRINHGACILASDRVSIGEEVAMGPGCTVLDSDLHELSIGGEARPIQAPVEIGDRVWIGSRCTLLKGAKIGTGSIIAAGSVVTGEIPPHVLAGGVPARVIATDASWRP